MFYKKALHLIFILLFLTQCSVQKTARTHPEELIHGYVTPGFEKVKQEFTENFASRGEKGAAFAVYYQGKKVVDLWGGYRNYSEGKKWEDSTMVMVFSTTKGMAALSLALAESRGYFNYNDKVAKYWPEFGENGKKDITIYQLLAHEAGLVVIEPPLSVDDLTNPDSVGQILAHQEPAWTPGERHGYHLSSMGLYMNELLRRVDPQHRTLGVFFHEEIAQPLNARFYIGLPDSIPSDQIAHVIFPNLFYAIGHINNMPKATRKEVMDRKSYLNKGFTTPQGFNPNDKKSQQIELPSGNGIGTARALAKIYHEFAMGAPNLQFDKNTFYELTAAANLPPAGPMDEVMAVPTYYRVGMLKPGPKITFGSSQKAFGTPGAGGSFAFADPDKQLGYAYVMTKMGLYLKDDPRETALQNAVYECIEIMEKNMALRQQSTRIMEADRKSQ